MKETLIRIKKNAFWASILWMVFMYLFVFVGVVLISVGFIVIPNGNIGSTDNGNSLTLGILGIVLLVVGIIGTVFILIFSKKRILNLINQLDYFREDFLPLLNQFILKPITLSFEITRKSNYILKNFDTIMQTAKIEEKENQLANNKDFLITERLKLRVFCDDDLDLVYKYRNNPDCNKYQSFSAFTKKEIKQLFAINKKPTFYENGDSLFAIAKNEDNSLVGELYTSKSNNEIYLGFTIAPEHQRKGYAFEILSDLIVKIILEIPNSKIYCSVFPKNIKSISLIKKLGFIFVSKVNSNDLGEVHIYQFKNLAEKPIIENNNEIKKLKSNKISKNKKTKTKK